MYMKQNYTVVIKSSESSRDMFFFQILCIKSVVFKKYYFKYNSQVEHIITLINCSLLQFYGQNIKFSCINLLRH